MSVLPFVRRTTSGEVPVLTRSLASKLSGSVAGATEAATQQAAVAANPSRLLLRQFCGHCLNRWQAPAKGRCPNCASDNVAVVEAVPCMAARL